VENLTELLPETLQKMVELTDLNAVLTLIQAHGGTTVHFPPVHLCSADDPVAKLIGHDRWLKLCRYWSGDTIYLPHAAHYNQALRDERIRRDAATMTNDALARKYHMSVTGKYARSSHADNSNGALKMIDKSRCFKRFGTLNPARAGFFIAERKPFRLIKAPSPA